MKYVSRLHQSMVAACCAILLIPAFLCAQSTSNMTLLGNFGKGEGEPRAIAASGSTVYYAVGTKLQIGSFATPASPQKVGSIELGETIRDINTVTISATKYLVIVAGARLFVVNIQNPTAPTLTSNTSLGATAQALVVSGTYAYLAAGSGGLMIYNISTPSAPTQTFALDTLEYAEGIAFSSPYVYVAAGDRTHILDVSNVSSPTYVARIPAQAGGYHQGVGVRGQYAYICDYELGIHTFNISNPSSPASQGVLSSGFGSSRMTFDGNYGYISQWDSGMTIIDITNGAAPTVAGRYNTPGQSSAVAFGSAGAPLAPYIFVADRSGGVRAINVSSASSPTESGFLPVVKAATGSAFAVTYNNGKAYVAYGTAGVRIIDVSNPATPTELGNFDTPGETRNVTVVGTTAYVSDRAGGVRILNITNPALITETGSIVLKNPRNVVISGNYGYVADFDSGMTVINISNPASPQKVASYPTASFNTENISMNGNVVVTASGHTSEVGAQLKIYDISTPGSPTLSATITLASGYTEGATINGNYLYMAHSDSLKIYDITNPASPVLKSSLSTPGYKRHFAVSGNYAYGAAGGSGVRVINISNPVSTTEAGYYDGTPNVRGVTASGSYVYSAEQVDGLSVYQNTLITSVRDDDVVPRSVSLYQNYPNPFNPYTTIKYELSKNSNVRLEIQNLLGQTVAVLFEGQQTSGEHAIQFDAKTYGSGTYIYRITANGQQISKKMLLVK